MTNLKTKKEKKKTCSLSPPLFFFAFSYKSNNRGIIHFKSKHANKHTKTAETMVKQGARVSKWMRQQKLNETFSNI